jgi:ATP-binding cassette subfamily B protein
MLEGYGIAVHYGRLREACQTDVDGTSIDVLEVVLNRLGLVADQVMMPVNHLLLVETEALPAILVVRLPNGFTHFVVVWRRHGPLVQVMDPAVGRRWIPCCRLLEEVFVHKQRVSTQAWHEWAQSQDFQRPLERRLRNVGFGPTAQTFIQTAAEVRGWHSIAELDAATRLLESLVRSGGLRPREEARRTLQALLHTRTPVIPEVFRSVLPAPPGSDGEEQVDIRGAVLIRVRGRRPASEVPPVTTEALSPELVAARTEQAPRPVRTLIGLLCGQGLLALVLITLGTALVAGGTVVEAVFLRGLIDLGRDLGVVEQRLGAIGLFLGFAGLLLLLEFRVATGLARLGRHLETRLRIAFFEKIPRLHDRYFQSRPTSDMAERSHAIHQIRLLPRLAGQLQRAAFTLLLTAGALAWFDPPLAPVALMAAACALGIPLAFQPLLTELNLRVRTHTGALSRFYLDALLGLAAVRAHSAERAVRREHESLLVEWARASRRQLRWVVLTEGLQMFVGFALAACLLFLHVSRLADAGGALLLAYWALQLPVLGEEIALVAQQYPMNRNLLLRLLEPLGAPEERTTEEREPISSLVTDGVVPRHLLRKETGGVAVTFDRVTVHAAGQTILQDICLHIEAGSQVAIVGASGAGKSSLVGLLLGWHRPASGQLCVDGERLDSARLDRLRNETAWVDPAIQLWNRTLLRNLLYGRQADVSAQMGAALCEADLYGVLQRLPDGLQTVLGEGGGLVSGGEGQRVRLGRAFLRAPVHLAILDEPFRGLDHAKRRDLLRRARQLWQGVTLLCITHDVAETRGFERVIVVDAGRIVEDGAPAQLEADPTSHYRALLDAEQTVRTGLWSKAVWQRLRLEDGQVIFNQAGGTE